MKTPGRFSELSAPRANSSILPINKLRTCPACTTADQDPIVDPEPIVVADIRPARAGTCLLRTCAGANSGFAPEIARQMYARRDQERKITKPGCSPESRTAVSGFTELLR